MARSVTVVDKSPNQFPQSLEDKIARIPEGQVIRLKLNPEKYKKVRMASGTSMDMNRPKHVQNVNKAGSIGIAAHWDVLWEGRKIPCGFFQGYDGAENPIFKPLKFNYGNDVFLYGDNPEHQDIYRLLQVHPQYRQRVTGPQPKAWVCEQDVAEAASSQELERFLFRSNIDSRVANLTQTELDILISAASYGTGFLNRPDAAGNAIVARGILVGELSKADGYAKISALLEKMDRVKEIATYQTFFADKKLSLMGKELYDEKGEKVTSFREPFAGKDALEAATFLYDKGRDIPAVKESIQAILNQQKGKK